MPKIHSLQLPPWQGCSQVVSQVTMIFPTQREIPVCRQYLWSSACRSRAGGWTRVSFGQTKVQNILLIEIKELNPSWVQWKRKAANIEFKILYISTEILMGKNQNLAGNTFKHWNFVLKDCSYSKKKMFQFHILAFDQMDIPQAVNRPKNSKIIPIKFLHFLKTLTHLWTINGINISR